MKTWNHISFEMNAYAKNNIGKAVVGFLQKQFIFIPSNWEKVDDSVVFADSDVPDEDAIVERYCKDSLFGNCLGCVVGCARTDKVCAVRIVLEPSHNIRAFAGKEFVVTVFAAPGAGPADAADIPEEAWISGLSYTFFGYIGYRLNGKFFSGIPFTGRNKGIWSALQGVDFPKSDIMAACRKEMAGITEEQYYKAEKAARQAFVNGLVVK